MKEEQLFKIKQLINKIHYLGGTATPAMVKVIKEMVELRSLTKAEKEHETVWLLNIFTELIEKYKQV